MKLFEELDKEHESIKRFIKKFDSTLDEIKSGTTVDIELFSKYLLYIRYYIDQLHHGKEEEILFPAVHGAGHLKEHGEKCMLFFDMFCQKKFLEKIQKEMSDLDNIEPYQYKEVLRPIFKNRSFLEVPLEDHQTGYYALKIMECELGKIKNDPSWSPDRLIRVAQIYLSMLHFHIRKEDECLFVALKKRFSEKELVELDQACVEFNSKFNFNLIPEL